MPAPPIRILVVGDDAKFNKFVTQYVSLLDLDVAKKKSSQGGDNAGSSGDKSNGPSIDKQRDVRIFLVPQNDNTLAHYIAMYDDLYCHNIYNFFNSNTILNLYMQDLDKERKSKNFASKVETLYNHERKEDPHKHLGYKMIDNAIQTYMNDSIRNIDVKIFKAEIFFGDKDKNEKSVPYYFTSRLEIGYIKNKGSASVYEKLEAVRNILNAPNRDVCIEKEEGVRG